MCLDWYCVCMKVERLHFKKVYTSPYKDCIMPLNYFLCHTMILSSTLGPVFALTSSSALSVHLSG